MEAASAIISALSVWTLLIFGAGVVVGVGTCRVRRAGGLPTMRATRRWPPTMPTPVATAAPKPTEPMVAVARGATRVWVHYSLIGSRLTWAPARHYGVWHNVVDDRRACDGGEIESESLTKRSHVRNPRRRCALCRRQET